MKKYSLLLGVMFAWFVVFSQKTTSPNNTPATVITCSDFHISKPLAELSAEHPFVVKKMKEKMEESSDRGHRTPQTFVHSVEENPLLYGNDPNTMQTTMGDRTNATKAPIKNWPGQTASGFRPQDPSGAAGTNHYIQAINGTPFRVYNKTTGANMLTANIGTLWNPDTGNEGDPIIMYDKYADRWFISQFGTSADKKIYIAISTTADPLGSYYTYSFVSPEFPDYLKFSIWADGYYMTSNQGTQRVFCFERDQMLIGNASARAVSQTYTTGATGGFFVPLPADADAGLPTVGTPCPFFCYTDNAWGSGAIDGVKIWNMAVTWGATPAAVITLNTTLPTTAFDASYDSGWNDIPQPGTTQKLDGIGGIPTYRAQWRKWTGYNSLVMNWGVKISASQRSIKWVELRQNQSTGVWSLYQQGTYTPDTHSRWLGSIAMDNNGSIALCYAKSSSSVFPSLCYTGRLSTDPLGTMTFSEEVAAAGTAAETSGNRYGDYSQTALDPDGLTFWHTGEYTLTSGTTTRVYSFQLPAPVLNAPPVAAFSASTTTPCIGSTVTFTDASTNSPTSWAWTFSPTTVTYVGGTSASSQNPQVQFNAAGSYTVTLVATNAFGNDNEIKTAYITPVSGGSLPLVENFEGATFPPTGWIVENADAPSIAWGTEGVKGLERRTATGNTGSATGCAGIEFFNYPDTAQFDNLISSPLNLTGASAPKMTFKRAYKTYVSATNPNNYRDELKVYISTDCGATWGSAVYFKKGAQLATNGTLNTTFDPAVAADWDIDTVNLNAYIGQTIKVKFEFVNRYGNNLYVDDININSSAAAVASVSIASSDADNSICAGASITFTATPTNGGTAPTYQWKVNGVNVGTNAVTYTTTTLTTGQSVTCVMTSNLPGVTGSPATSNAIVTTVNAIPATPTITTNSPVCAGSTINLSTSSVTGATYAWSGPNVFTSSTQNPTISNATTTMAGTYNLTVITNGCTSAAGNASVVVNASVAPSVSIAITTGGNPTCVSQSVTFTATPTNGGASPSYQWKVNGVNAGTNSATFTPGSIANNDVITCVMTSNATCISTPTATSNAITMTVTTSVTPSVAITANNNPACIGATVTFTAVPTNGGTTPTYQWQVNGGNVGTNSATYSSSTLTNGQVVTCIMTSSSSCASTPTATSNAITMSFVSSVTPTASISLTSGTNPACSGTSLTFTATGTNLGTAPSYQWQVNGLNVGTNASTYTSSSIANGNNVTCIITSNASCLSASTATSNTITVTVSASVTPTVTIATTNNPACEGTPVTFTTSATNQGTSPTYTWYLNGGSVATGASYITSSLTNIDVVHCVMTSNVACATSSTATSNNISMTINSSAAPTIATSITGGANPSCQGSNVTFTANATNQGTSPTYQWQVNGSNAGTNSSTFSSTTLNSNDIVTCIVTSNAACANPATATSAPTTMIVNPIPSTPSITLTGGNTLTSNSPTGNQWYLNGTIIIGATAQTYVATSNGNYTVIVTNGGCSSAASEIVTTTIGINEVSNVGTHFIIYPNPSTGKFTVVFTSTEIMEYKIELRSVIGQLVYFEDIKNFNGTYTKNFDITEYGKGEYFMVITDSKQHKMEKLIVF